MPGWSGAMPAVIKTIKPDSQKNLHLLLGSSYYPIKYSPKISQVWLLSEPVSNFQGACERNGELAGCHPGAAAILSI